MKKQATNSTSNFEMSDQLMRVCQSCKVVQKQDLFVSQELCEKCHRNESQSQQVKKDHRDFMKKIKTPCFQDKSEELSQKLMGKSFNQSKDQIQIDGTSNQSEDQYNKAEEQKLVKNIRSAQQQIIAEKKVIIGTGFTYDMTDFFKFKKKAPLQQKKEITFLQEIAGSRIAWLILLYTITSSAIVPGWIMNIPANKFLRQCWRFLMQSVILVPFVIHQKRIAPQENKQRYELNYILKPNNIIKPYVSSLSSSLFFLFILTSFQWTYVSHGLVLGSLSNFFLSIGRTMRKANHDLQLGGQMLVVMGVCFVLNDSVTLNETNITTDDYLSQNTFYLNRSWYERIGGDLMAILTSLMMAQFSKLTSDLRSYYPPFLSMMLVNIFNVFNMGLISFFFNGATFDFNSYWGIFSIFTDVHFISFMYMAIFLTLGQLVSVLLITKMFPDPIIPALGMTLQPFIASLIVQLGNIQNLPGDFSMIGFIFIFPGLLVVLMGQCFYQRQKSTAQESDKRVQTLLQQIKLLRDMNKLHKISRMNTLSPLLNTKSRRFNSAKEYKKKQSLDCQIIGNLRAI